MRRRFSLIARLLAALSLPIVARGAPASGQPPLILVSIDGYRADYLQRVTCPCWPRTACMQKACARCFVTGLHPHEHGMVNNTMHHPVLEIFSPPDRAANIDGRWWDEAEPIRHAQDLAGVCG